MSMQHSLTKFNQRRMARGMQPVTLQEWRRVYRLFAH